MSAYHSKTLSVSPDKHPVKLMDAKPIILIRGEKGVGNNRSRTRIGLGQT